MKAQTETLKKFTAERQALDTADPGTLRLVTAAEQALAEGAIKASRTFLGDAKSRIHETRSSIEVLEAKAKAKRKESAALLAMSGEVAAMDLDYEAAANDFASASEWVLHTDAVLSASYKLAEAESLAQVGHLYNDIISQNSALTAFKVVERIALNERNKLLLSQAKNGLANSLLLFAPNDPIKIATAIDCYRTGLSALPTLYRQERLSMANNLAGSLMQQGVLEASIPLLKQSYAILEEAASEVRQDNDGIIFAQIHNNSGSVCKELWALNHDERYANLSLKHYRSSLTDEI